MPFDFKDNALMCDLGISPLLQNTMSLFWKRRTVEKIAETLESKAQELLLM